MYVSDCAKIRPVTICCFDCRHYKWHVQGCVESVLGTTRSGGGRDMRYGGSDSQIVLPACPGAEGISGSLSGMIVENHSEQSKRQRVD